VIASEREALQRDLTALAGGDRGAFDPVFRRLFPLVRGFAARFLPVQEAEDAAQEALLRVFSRASEFDPGRDALSWVLGVTAWQVRTHRTRARRRREESVADAPEPADSTPSPESAAIASELAALVDRVLRDLSPSDAATLIAYGRGERPDLPGATFRKRVERALGRLRASWRIRHDSL
jgi:RNA polymerase sigma-70 factor (ECF subfamily)